MDNALIIDGVIAVVLIAGTLLGAHRGLFKSLMGLLVLLAALIGATVLANILTPAAAKLLYPLVRKSVLERVSAALPAPLGGLADLPAVEQAARTLLESVVHAALLLALYIVLLLILRLLACALDHVFDLPVLSTANHLGGAALGLLEAALLLYVAVYVTARLGGGMLADHADDTYLLPIFLNHSPVELISSFTQKG